MQLPPTITPKPDDATESGDDVSDEGRKRLGHSISFGLQQTLTCLATDIFIDPVIGKKIQGTLGSPVTYTQTWGGELAGDAAALVAFVGLQQIAPGVTRTVAKAARAHLNSLLEHTGNKHLKIWARKEHVEVGSEQYRQKLEEWKDMQAENVAKSSIMSVGSIIGNVVAQKALLRNPNKLLVITAGKLAGAAITMGAMLTARNYLPKSTQMLDEELNERYIAPVIRNTQKALGVDVDRKPHHHHHHHNGENRHALKVSDSRDMAAGNASIR